MSFTVLALVLLAAALHAGWNAIVKGARDTLLTTVMVAVCSAAIAALALPWLAAPAPASWPFIAASTVLQVGYFVLVARAYGAADMSLAYPLMRGSAPLLVALASAAVLHEPLSPAAWSGVTLLCAGILALALVGSRGAQRAGLGYALLNALVIAAYTLIDGAGVRRSGAPLAYTLWIYLLTGLPLTAWALLRRRPGFVAQLSKHWRVGLAAGAATIASYALALWAMTQAPVAVVAALRETSIVFAMLISGLVLKERLGLARVLAGCAIVAGAGVLRLA
ncbi:EamA family transporter [Rubrivivax gelatinosus]|uniref:EamA family transporter n=1 Tax=Rubrivivax gelatinosus TaxID=28068 RepID=A0ABS1DU49_RUBGE|nr:EamA family transporter [Rubrivivax gelatinosus]MBK1713033.1 EamA family transporter [Rubrivivax gelatinosus]